MSSSLFNNKYYNQLFGGKRRDEEEPKPQTPEHNDEVTEVTEGTVSTSATETTRDRLNRIFGGAPKGVKGSAKPKVAKPVLSDAEYAATGKVQRYKDMTTADGRMIFQFKNGALAVRDPSNGRFIIIQGASAEKMNELRQLKAPKGSEPKTAKKVSTAMAQKAFSAYWNRKLREAKRFDKEHGLAGTKQSKAAAVRRSKTYRATHMRASPKYHLSPENKGYLYLRKERVLRDASGMPAKRPDGSIRVRRAGPAIYDFEDVPAMHKGEPVVKKQSKRKRPSTKAIEAIKKYSESRKGVTAASPRAPGRYLTDDQLVNLSIDKIKQSTSGKRAAVKKAKTESRKQYTTKSASTKSTASPARSYRD
jgi:hypothetical protein